MNDDVKRLFQNIRLLALDVDGVLTDGGVYVLEDGTEFRRFDIKDGLGLKRVIELNIAVVVISLSSVEAVRHRCAQLGIFEIHLGVKDKLECLQAVCARLNISIDQVAYIGDDLPDLPILERVGLPCAPSDAVSEVKRAALYIANRRGGDGAIREISELICRASR